ncbi:hypothetical protein BJV74DRAFT_510605 [Russula compacta]|nr:hypothetical protein BJV74DRAFT_510605 [Russula compacta]
MRPSVQIAAYATLVVLAAISPAVLAAPVDSGYLYVRDGQDLTRDTASVLQVSERDIADPADGLFSRTLGVGTHSGRNFVDPNEGSHAGNYRGSEFFYPRGLDGNN